MLRRSFLATTLTAVLAAALATGGATFALAQDGPTDIIATASKAEGFSTFVAAVEAAGLTETLTGEGPYTVFAPENAAFEALEPGVLDDLLKPENQAALQAVLSFHVLPGKILYADLTEDMDAETISGETIRITVDGDTKTIGNALIVGSDIEASNGVIHVPDRVIVPE